MQPVIHEPESGRCAPLCRVAPRTDRRRRAFPALAAAAGIALLGACMHRVPETGPTAISGVFAGSHSGPPRIADDAVNGPLLVESPTVVLNQQGAEFSVELRNPARKDFDVEVVFLLRDAAGRSIAHGTVRLALDAGGSATSRGEVPLAGTGGTVAGWRIEYWVQVRTRRERPVIGSR